jgi:hypothetical protein
MNGDADSSLLLFEEGQMLALELNCGKCLQRYTVLNLKPECFGNLRAINLIDAYLSSKLADYCSHCISEK